MHTIRLAAALAVVALVACSSADAPRDTGTPTPSGSSSGGAVGGGASTGGGGGGATGGGGGGAGGGASAACGLAGIWTGPIEGSYVDLLQPSKRHGVTGSATVKLGGAAKGVEIDADSGIEIVLKDILGPGRDSTVKRPLTGGGSCESLDAKGDGDTGIIKVNVSASCKFAGDKCVGTWTAVTPGKNGAADSEVANGTFSLAKSE